MLTTTDLKLKVETCCECSVTFAMTEDMYKRRLEDGNLFYCPNGHGQHYTSAKDAKQKIKELENQLRFSKNRETHFKELEEHRRHQVRAYKAHRTRLKNAIIRGNCPCCGEHFEDMQKHIEARHPAYIAAEKEES